MLTRSAWRGAKKRQGRHQVPARSRQRRATPPLGRLPARSLLHAPMPYPGLRLRVSRAGSGCGRCRGRQRPRNERRPCFSIVPAARRCARTAKCPWRFQDEPISRWASRVMKQLSNRRGSKPVVQGNTPGDPHTIPLRVLCSVHCACSTNTTCNTNRRRQRPTSQSPLCTRIFSLLERAMPPPARALRAHMPCPCLHVACPSLVPRGHRLTFAGMDPLPSKSCLVLLLSVDNVKSTTTSPSLRPRVATCNPKVQYPYPLGCDFVRAD